MAAQRANQRLLGDLLNNSIFGSTKVKYPEDNKKLINWILDERRRFEQIPGITDFDKFRWMSIDLPPEVARRLTRDINRQMTAAVRPVRRVAANRDPTNVAFYQKPSTIEQFVLSTVTFKNNKIEMVKKLERFHYPKAVDPRQVMAFLSNQFEEIDAHIELLNSSPNQPVQIQPLTEEEKCNIIRSVFYKNNNLTENNSSAINKRIKKAMESIQFNDVVGFMRHLPTIAAKGLPEVIDNQSYKRLALTNGELEIGFTSKKRKRDSTDSINPNTDRKRQRFNNVRQTNYKSIFQKRCRNTFDGKTCRVKNCRFRHPQTRQSYTSRINDRGRI